MKRERVRGREKWIWDNPLGLNKKIKRGTTAQSFGALKKKTKRAKRKSQFGFGGDNERNCPRDLCPAVLCHRHPSKWGGGEREPFNPASCIQEKDQKGPKKEFASPC